MPHTPAEGRRRVTFNRHVALGRIGGDRNEGQAEERGREVAPVPSPRLDWVCSRAARVGVKVCSLGIHVERARALCVGLGSRG